MDDVTGARERFMKNMRMPTGIESISMSKCVQMGQVGTVCKELTTLHCSRKTTGLGSRMGNVIKVGWESELR